MNKNYRALFCALIVSLGATRLASAQSVIDPNFVEFNPSPDHSVTLSSGASAVSRYELEFFQAGSTSPVQVVDLGKPPVASDGKIHISFLPTWPTAGVVYEARINSVGPGGEVESSQSNQFTFSGACGYVTSTSRLSFGASGGAGSVSVLANAGCTWSATSSVNWVSVMSGSVSGAGTVSLNVSPNTSGSARSTTLTVAGELVTIDQAAGTTCPGVAAVSTVSLSSSATTGSIAVNASSGCAWQASSSAAWLAVTPASGSGAASAYYSASANTGTTPRTATIKLASSTITVTQPAPGGSASTCTPTFSPSSVAVDAAGGVVKLGISSTCDWLPAPSAAWITVSRANGMLTVSVAPNTSSSARSGAIGASLTSIPVSQKANLTCSAVASLSTLSLPNTTKTGTVGVNAASGCGWTAKSSASWLTVTPASGSGASSVSYSAAANTTTSVRTATLQIASTLVTVSQAAGTATCSSTVAQSSVSVPAAGGSALVGVVSNLSTCKWTATSTLSWVTLSGTMTGTSSVKVTVAPNPTPTSRNGMVQIAGRSVNVSQPGTPCAYTLSTTSLSVAKTAGSGGLVVKTTAACAWTARSNASWITITSLKSLSGNDEVLFSFTANSSTSARTGTLTVAGKVVTITQAKR